MNEDLQAKVQRLSAEHWDAIVVGTGMGGATIGRRLTQAGLKVLFLERGEDLSQPAFGERGKYPESSLTSGEFGTEKMKKFGRWSRILEIKGRKASRFTLPFMGEGTGGSSALYGAALERFELADFSPRQYFKNHPDLAQSTLEDAWPVSFKEMTGYYKMAEDLFACVKRRTEDLGQLSDCSREFFDFFSRANLNPYILPVARDLRQDCLECQGYLCSKDCKHDANRMVLRPALGSGAQLLSLCEVTCLKSEKGQVKSVQAQVAGQEAEFHATIVILAAGALGSPEILLRSKSEEWPQGLGNESGWVGKNLMRHYVDIYMIFAKSGRPQGRSKELAFNDWYLSEGQKLGTVQGFGRLHDARLITREQEFKLRITYGNMAAFAFRAVSPLIRIGLQFLFDRTYKLATVVEDLPFKENCVELTQAGIKVNYELRPGETERIRLMRSKMKQLLRPYFYFVIKAAEDTARLAHACGTCRMGTDPKSSIVDANNRVYGLGNLYVVDGSVFPSSAGINPGLTIIANALRVGDHLLKTQFARHGSL